MRIAFFPRIQPNGQPHATDNQIWRRREALRAVGIELQDVPQGADLAWCHTHRAAELLATCDLPLIVDDQRDSATIHAGDRKFLEHDRVLAFVKHSAYRDRQRYNAAHYDATLHGTLIWDRAPAGTFSGTPREIIPPLSASALAKITLGWGYQYYDRYASLYANEPQPGKRPIDVHFVGTTVYGKLRNDPHSSAGLHTITWHRQQLVAKLRALADRRGWNIVAGESRDMNFNLYCRQIQQAKLVVCPWGYGERTHREYEATLCGCAIIRPDTRWCESWPEIPYTPVSAGWDNLEVAIEQTLGGWRLAAREELMATASDAAFAQRFAEIIASAKTSENQRPTHGS